MFLSLSTKRTTEQKKTKGEKKLIDHDSPTAKVNI
jgi:hypothetical protein